MAVLGQLLFYRRDQVDLDAVLRHQADCLREKVDALSDTVFREKTDHEIAANVAASAAIQPLQVDFAAATAEVQEVQVEVHDRYGFERGPVRVPGLRATKSIPFTGDRDLWLRRTNPWNTNPPHGDVHSGKLIIGIEVAASQTDEATRYIEDTLRSIPEYLERQRAQIESHNATLAGKSMQWIQLRRARLGQASDLLKKLQG